MKAYRIQFDNGRSVLLPAEVPVPDPGAGQLCVQLHAAGLNRGEFLAGGLVPPGAPRPAGMEGAGVVAALGPGVAGWQVGDRVMGRCPGAFAEYALMDAREAMPVPPGLSMHAAAAVPLTFLVVHDMLIAQGRLSAGDWLLVTGVSSGVGVAALQVAKALGAHVIGTSGAQEKLDRLVELGLDMGIATRAPDFASRVLAATGQRGVDLVVNTVGGTMFAECVRALAYQGRLAMVGHLDHRLKAEIDLQALHARRLTLFGVSNKLRSADERAAAVPPFVSEVLPALADGRIRPLVDRVYALDELPAAQAHMEANRHLGKIVVQIGA